MILEVEPADAADLWIGLMTAAREAERNGRSGHRMRALASQILAPGPARPVPAGPVVWQGVRVTSVRWFAVAGDRAAS